MIISDDSNLSGISKNGIDFNNFELVESISLMYYLYGSELLKQAIMSTL